jgi:peptidoglycan hydrolase CwlO-like protein
MKKTLYIILVIAAIVFLIFLFLPDKPHETRSTDHAEVVTSNDTFKVHEAAAAKREQHLQDSIKQLNALINDLKAGQKQTRQELDKSKNLAQRLANDIRGYNQDTGVYGRKMDSLIGQVDNLTFLVGQYEQYSDSLNTVNAQQQGKYDSLLTERAKIYSELRTNYDKVFSEYNKVFKENKSTQKDLRREKLKTKIAAVLGLVAAGFMIMK